MSIARSYLLTAAADKEVQLEEALTDLASALSKAEGSEGTRILKDMNNPQSYRFMEFWTNEVARKAAGRLVDEGIMGRMMGALDGKPASEDHEVLK